MFLSVVLILRFLIIQSKLYAQIAIYIYYQLQNSQKYYNNVSLQIVNNLIVLFTVTEFFFLIKDKIKEKPIYF